MTGICLEPSPRDILVTWNRVGVGQVSARAFERKGLHVLVTENATWGNDFAGEQWLYLGKNWHNMTGRFPIGPGDRWDALGIDMQPWRSGGETVILPQRGIGQPPVAMPARWAQKVVHSHPGRIRAHPGIKNCIPLEQDLAQCGHVITWGSGAAIKALMMGIKVTSYMPDWIGQCDNTDADRLRMFRELAWAQFRLSEFESGEAFARMLN